MQVEFNIPTNLLIKDCFESQLHMLKHEQSTEKDPPFECDYCGIDFGSYNVLREHKELHLNRPNFQCLECDYVGYLTKLLKQHMRKHASSTE